MLDQALNNSSIAWSHASAEALSLLRALRQHDGVEADVVSAMHSGLSDRIDAPFRHVKRPGLKTTSTYAQ